MKTAVSLPDDLFASADAFAEREQLSRSELYARALREFLARHDQDQITSQLDAVAEEVDSRIDPVVRAATRRRLAREAW